MTWAEDYKNDGTIHGIDLILKARKKKERLIWTALFILLSGWLGFDCYKIGKKYLSQPVSVEMKQVAVHHIPSILVCPFVWADEDKLKSLQDPREVYGFWLKHKLNRQKPESDFLYPWPHSQSLESYRTHYATFLKSDMPMRSKLINLLNEKYGTVKNFLLNVSRDPADVFHADYSAWYSIPAEKVVTAESVCYFLPQSSKYPKYATQFVYYDIFMQNINPPFGIKTGHDRLYFDVGSIRMPMDPLEIPNGQQYKVYVTLTNRISVSTRSNPCQKWSISDQYACAYECVNTFICAKCKFVDVRETTNFTGLCTDHDLYVTFEHCLIKYISYSEATKQAAEMCEAKCPQPCEVRKHAYTVLPAVNLIHAEPNVTGVRIRLYSSLGSTHFEEKYAYHWSTLISNFGGVVSLFFGASLLSLAHIIVLTLQQMGGITRFCKNKHSSL